MKIIIALILGLVLATTVEAIHPISSREHIVVQNSPWRTFFVAPHGFYYDSFGRVIPVGFRFSRGRLIKTQVIVEPVVTFGVWKYTPEFRIGNPWWKNP